MSNNETLADILAEMRLGSTDGLPCAYRIGRPNPTGHIRIDHVTVCELADRIEAAHARESGNAAAMREAAEKLVGYLPKFLDAIDYYGIDGYYSSCYKKDLKELHGRMDFLKSALAAPPRNCDRFADEQDAKLTFLNEVWLISVDRDSTLEKDRFENWTDEMRSAYARWLMAEAKGGAE